MTDYRSLVANLVAQASEGAINQAEALDSTTTLTEKGFSSLSFLRLIDSLENEFGIYVDLESDTTYMQSVEGIVGHLSAELN